MNVKLVAQYSSSSCSVCCNAFRSTFSNISSAQIRQHKCKMCRRAICANCTTTQGVVIFQFLSIMKIIYKDKYAAKICMSCNLDQISMRGLSREQKNTELTTVRKTNNSTNNSNLKHKTHNQFVQQKLPYKIEDQINNVKSRISFSDMIQYLMNKVFPKGQKALTGHILDQFMSCTFENNKVQDQDNQISSSNTEYQIMNIHERANNSQQQSIITYHTSDCSNEQNQNNTITVRNQLNVRLNIELEDQQKNLDNQRKKYLEIQSQMYDSDEDQQKITESLISKHFEWGNQSKELISELGSSYRSHESLSTMFELNVKITDLNKEIHRLSGLINHQDTSHTPSTNQHLLSNDDPQLILELNLLKSQLKSKNEDIQHIQIHLNQSYAQIKTLNTKLDSQNLHTQLNKAVSIIKPHAELPILPINLGQLKPFDINDNIFEYLNLDDTSIENLDFELIL